MTVVTSQNICYQDQPQIVCTSNHDTVSEIEFMKGVTCEWYVSMPTRPTTGVVWLWYYYYYGIVKFPVRIAQDIIIHGVIGFHRFVIIMPTQICKSEIGVIIVINDPFSVSP